MAYEKTSATEVIGYLRFWKDHPHAGLPSYINQAIAVMERQKAESKRLRNCMTDCVLLRTSELISLEAGWLQRNPKVVKILVDIRWKVEQALKGE